MNKVIYIDYVTISLYIGEVTSSNLEKQKSRSELNDCMCIKNKVLQRSQYKIGFKHAGGRLKLKD